MFGLWTYTETHSVLGSAAYEAIRAGDSAIEVQTRVPSVSYEVGPRDVKKPGCVYYRVRQFAPRLSMSSASLTIGWQPKPS